MICENCSEEASTLVERLIGETKLMVCAGCTGLWDNPTARVIGALENILNKIESVISGTDSVNVTVLGRVEIEGDVTSHNPV